MKRIVSVIVVLFVLFQLKGQEINQLDKIIISSIKSYIIDDKDFVRQQDTSRYYICMDGLPADFPCDSVQNATFFSLKNLEGLPNSFKHQLKTGIKTLFVGLKISNNQIIITVSGRVVRRLKKNDTSIGICD
ncbi:MAG: hypothetical protein EOL95_04715 [Bacteroidia bacterium]|nr:hypothetical protein [Bacteroidia bacterium]